jgi:hypothetical protein
MMKIAAIVMGDRFLSALSTVIISDPYLIQIKSYEGPKLPKMWIFPDIR